MAKRVHGMDSLLCLQTDYIDGIVVAATKARGIPMGNAPGILATAGVALVLIMATGRRTEGGEMNG